MEEINIQTFRITVVLKGAVFYGQPTNSVESPLDKDMDNWPVTIQMSSNQDVNIGCPMTSIVDEIIHE